MRATFNKYLQFGLPALSLLVACTSDLHSSRTQTKPSDESEIIEGYIIRQASAKDGLEIEVGNSQVTILPDTFTVDYEVRLNRGSAPSQSEIGGVVIGSVDSDVVTFDFVYQSDGLPIPARLMQRPVLAALKSKSEAPAAELAAAILHKENAEPKSISVHPISAKAIPEAPTDANVHIFYFYETSGEAWLTLSQQEFAGHFLIGQTNGVTNSNVELSIRPKGVYIAQDTLYVSDGQGNRVLGWHPVPTTPRPADFVLGQGDLFGTAPNNGGVSASSLFSPIGVSGVGEKLIVADWGNYRILIWNKLPKSNAAPADIVLGQSDLTSIGARETTPSAYQFEIGYGISATTEALYAADYNNSRVLIWSPFPTSSNEAPARILGQALKDGQPDFTAKVIATSASGLRSAGGVLADGRRVYVADSGNNRVLIWDSPLPASGSAADRVLGQSSFTIRAINAGGAASANGLSYPRTLSHDGTYLFVADTNNRVVGFDAPISTIPNNFAPASFVVGQSDFTGKEPNRGGNTAAGIEMNDPHGIMVHQGSLFVTDSLNRRVLSWIAPNSYLNSNPASFAIGRPNVETISGYYGAVDDRTLAMPRGVWTDAQRLLVADTENNRVLLWNNLDDANSGKSPNVLLGQPNVTSTLENNGGAAVGMHYPRRAVISDGRLFVVDSENHRILIWNSIPETSGTAPSVVIGHPDLASTNLHTGSASLAYPSDICFDGSRIVVADTQRSRVVIFNSVPSANGASADVVLGQSNFTGTERNSGGLGAGSLSQPDNVICTGGKLLVSDTRNHRILIWNSIPTTNKKDADIVIGQSDFTSAEGGIGADKLRSPGGMVVDSRSGKLYVADQGNNRILEFDQLPTVNGSAASRVIGQENFTSSFGALAYGRFQAPRTLGIVGDKLYVADSGNGRIYVLPLPIDTP